MIDWQRHRRPRQSGKVPFSLCFIILALIVYLSGRVFHVW